MSLTEQRLATFSTDRPADRLAQAVSIICSPPLLALPMTLLAAAHATDGSAVGAAVTLLIATTLLPSLFVYTAYRAGYVRDFDLARRSERVIPSAFAALCSAGAYPILRQLEAPSVLLAIGAALTVQLVVLALVTTFWKVSYHAATAGGLVAIACTLEGASLGLPLAALAALISWARVRLGRHTPPQVVVGLLSAAPLLWWTWPS